jgi:hypothetical protein
MLHRNMGEAGEVFNQNFDPGRSDDPGLEGRLQAGRFELQDP